MYFDDYPILEEIKTEIKRLGWKRPTDIQFKAIKPILEGEDVLAIAQTGTGKTASFVIPTLHKLGSSKNKYARGQVKCLVMVPTRELAIQIADVYTDLGKKLSVKVLPILGGVEQDAQISQLKSGVDIVISTPGRLFDLVAQGHLDISRIDTLVLDEADHMLDLGFSKDIKDLMRHIPQRRQTLFFSATIDKRIKSTAYDIVRNAIRIQISPKNPVAKNINHSVVLVEMDDKRFFLERLVKDSDEAKMIVFVRTKVRAERVQSAMQRVSISSEILHGGIEQQKRFKLLNDFKQGKVNLLITTDVAARGIDVPNVEIVVNYDLPEQPENYVHRVGRTGRGDSKGLAISFCSEGEKNLLEAIEKFTGDKIPLSEMDNSAYKEIIYESEEKGYDWKSLIEEEEAYQAKVKKKNKKK